MSDVPAPTAPSGPRGGLRDPHRLLRRLARRPLIRKVRGLVRDRRSADTMMLGLAVLVGLVTGLLAVVLIEALHLVQELSFGAAPGQILVVAVPTLGGLAVGLITARAVPEARGSGIAPLLEAVALHGGRIRARVAPGKLVTSAISLGTGASGGREAPIVVIGGAIGSLGGRLLALDEEQKRALIAAGAGAGIAASFNAPIGGMLFALEVIIGGFRARYLQVVVVASVVASVTARELVGEGLIYSVPSYRLGAPAELLLYGLVGLGAVLIGRALIHGEVLVGEFTARSPLPRWLSPAIGGLGVGVIALAIPEVLGTGEELPPVAGVETEPIAQLLAGGLGGTSAMALATLALLIVAKLVATCIAIGTGSSVGSFAPAIFLGAGVGALVGHSVLALAPDSGLAPGALAMAGMAACIAVVFRAPLTGILIAFELTGDYGMVVPLMLAVGIATLVSDRVSGGLSIATLPLARKGIVVGEPEDVDILQTVTVGEVMTRDPDVVQAAVPLADLRAHFAETGRHGFPVLDGDRLIGVVTLSDLIRAESLGDGPSTDRLTAGDVCTRRPLTVTPADPVFRAVRRMAQIDVGRLPVVSPEDHGRLVGLIRRNDVVSAYQRAVTRSLGSQQRRSSERLRDLGGVSFVELVVDAHSQVAGREVRTVTWPPRTILTSVRRQGEVVVPRGDTVLEAGDEVVALTDSTAVEDVRALLSAPERL